MMMMMKNPMTLMTCTLLFSSLAVMANRGSFGPEKCCFNYISTRLRKDRVVSYKFTDKQCSMKGVVFTMKENAVKICANPSEPWVKFIMKAKERL